MSFADVHVPVMLDSIVEILGPALTGPGSIYVDATLGLAGHARAILDACPQARLIGIDRDTEAHAVARERLGDRLDRSELVLAVNDQLDEALAQANVRKVDAVLFDLGLSSLQIDRTERGFAYRVDSALDMRMGREGPSAADLLNNSEPGHLVRILRQYGEERFAERIVEGIVAQRKREAFATSAQLVDVISRAIPVKFQRTGGHPAKRTFQALRIAVNDELGALQRSLAAALQALRVGGRIAVLSYHSLEDRPVKQAFAAGASDRAPAGLPVVPEHLKPELALLTRGAQRPSATEVASNPRAASARLRAAERIREAT